MYTAAFFADPSQWYNELLASDSRVAWNEHFYGGAWLLWRYRDVLASIKDNELLTSEKSASLVDQYPPEYRPEIAQLSEYIGRWLAWIDPPRHTRIRRLLQKHFSLDMVHGFRPVVQQLVDELLDEALAQNDREIELVRQFSYKLPVQVICAMMGVPRQDYAYFMHWLDDIANFLGSSHPPIENARRCKAAMNSLRDYFRDLVRSRQGKPTHDLLQSMIVANAADEEALTEEELYANCISFLFAGHETTSNLIGNGMYALLRHPDQLQRLRAEPELTRSFIEEVLRFDGSVQYTFRLARQSFAIHDQVVKGGDIVVYLLAAANRDPEVFERPEQFDLGRAKNPHLTFGYGVHFCLGAPLARMEADVAFRTLLKRLAHIELAEPAHYHPVLRFRGLEALKLRFVAQA